MQSLFSPLFTQMLAASISSPVHFLVFVLVFYGLRKELSWFHTHMKVIRANTLVFSGLSSILVLFLALWYVLIFFPLPYLLCMQVYILHVSSFSIFIHRFSGARTKDIPPSPQIHFKDHRLTLLLDPTWSEYQRQNQQHCH